MRVPQLLAATLLAALGASLSGCADMSDSMTSAFADPAKYELWNCKQLEGERKAHAKRLAELQGLMAKAQTGVAGPVVAELAYRNEYIAVRGRRRTLTTPGRATNVANRPPSQPRTPPRKVARLKSCLRPRPMTDPAARK